MRYEERLREIEDNQYLIGMVPIAEILRFGCEAGLNPASRVLDLCCGYGTVLKVWSEALGSSGVGVDLCEDFIHIGQQRLLRAGVNNVALTVGDVTQYADAEKYDLVICSETIGTIADTLALGEKFLKPGGLLAYQKLYSKVPNPPRALVDFDGAVLPLDVLNRRFRELGFVMTAMAGDTDAKWEEYVLSWCGRRNLDAVRRHPDDPQARAWMERWTQIYFEHRRPCEGQALFGLERIPGVL